MLKTCPKNIFFTNPIEKNIILEGDFNDGYGEVLFSFLQ